LNIKRGTPAGESSYFAWLIDRRFRRRAHQARAAPDRRALVQSLLQFRDAAELVESGAVVDAKQVTLF
jgi:hypothetical protein